MEYLASTIVITYNGAKKICGVLDALAAQDIKAFEVIVVIDGSTDNTYDIVKAYHASFNKLSIHQQMNGGRSNAKNAGARLASTSLLIFYDDDMIPSPSSVKQHCQFHLTHEAAILAGSPIELVEPSKTDIQNYKAQLTKTWTAKYIDGITLLTADNLFFTAANCSIPLPIFERLNGFDERLNDAEDFDFACRALETNINVFLDCTNVALHNDPITCRSYIKRLREYSLAHAKLRSFHSKHQSNIASPARGIKHSFYRLFAQPFLVRLIDRGFFALFLPRKMRYRFYSIVIHALSVEYPSLALL